MNEQGKMLIAIMGCATLSACHAPESAYYTNYKHDYIYNVTYYGYRPYDWGDGYYNDFGWGTRDWNRTYNTYQQGIGPRTMIVGRHR